MLSYVKDGRLVKVTGDPKHGFTQGHLCAKGYAYTQYVYNSLRLKYPIIQSPRGSGNWKRISWDEAYTMIAEKMIELFNRYGSNLASGYNKFSGNLGLLHTAVEGMFNSIGPHTKPIGNICLATGANAMKESLGQLISPIPEQMANSKAIILWGANPAVTNIHQMKFIYTAVRNGAKLIVIDPIYSETATKADVYIQINPGTDALLALGVTKLLLEGGHELPNLMKEETKGWDDYKGSICKEIDLSYVSKATGVSLEVIERLAHIYATVKPTATWIGFGLQRNKLGRASVKAVNSLVALSGNLYIRHGGLYYSHEDLADFPLALLTFPEKNHPTLKGSRTINITNFPIEAQNFSDPPLKFLWIASRSTLSQDQHVSAWKELLHELEFIVTVDLYMTETAKHSDLVLPAASHFEEEDLNVGYWHHWLSINQKAILPFFEAKSDLKIARELTSKLNELSPGFSTFPADLEPLDWIEKELSPEIKKLYGIHSYKDLLESPRHRIYEDDSLSAEANKFSFINSDEIEQLIADVKFDDHKEKQYPFRLLSPQALLKLHSQFTYVSWLHPEPDETLIEMNEEVALEKGINDGEKVKLFNQNGEITASVKLDPLLPKEVILVEQTSNNSINQLIGIPFDEEDHDESTFFYDSYVNVMK